MMKEEGLYMAKIERIINKDFDQLLSTIEDGIIMAVCQHLWRIPVTFEAKMRVAASGYLNATAIPVVTG